MTSFWTTAKLNTLQQPHDVHRNEVFAVFHNRPRYFIKVTDEGTRFSMLGPNDRGRYLLVVIAQVEGDLWRVITAYWLQQRRGERLYREG